MSLFVLQICDHRWNIFLIAIWGGQLLNEIHHVSKTFVYGTYYSGTCTAIVMVLYAIFVFFPNYFWMWGVENWVGTFVAFVIATASFTVFAWEVTEYEVYQPSSILITGGATGIGAELMAMYARKGCVISICGRSKERLDAIKEKLVASGAEVNTSVLDVSNEVELKQFIDEANDKKPLDLLLANACTKGNYKEEAIVNLAATVATVDYGVSVMVGNHRATVVLMSSLGIFQTSPFQRYYISIKRALFDYGVGMIPVANKNGAKMVICCPGMSRDDAGRFIMSYKESAEYIYNGLMSKQHFIIYPYYQYIALASFGMLPYSLQAVIYGKQIKNKDD